MSALKRVQQWATFAQIWHIYDATWQNPFQSAEVIKKYLMGIYKPIYHPLNKCGDHVIVINSRDIALPGDEWRKRVYFHHTGYPGGASWTLAWELHEKDPTMVKRFVGADLDIACGLIFSPGLKVLKKAVYNGMDGNLQRRYTMQRLHIFPDDKVPESLLQNVSNQIRQVRPVPKRLDHYPEEEVKKFPKIFEYPEGFILR